MTTLVQVELDNGGCLLLESVEASAIGPVKVGRTTDAVQELQDSFRAVLRPVAQASREVFAELRAAGPDEVKVEFGLKLTASAGAVVAKTEVGCHFKVTMTWTRPVDEQAAGREAGMP